MSVSWRWAGACSRGTSHVGSGTPCQDRGSCILVETAAGPHLAMAVADGAGSAVQAALGAAVVCHGFQRAAVRHLRAGHTLEGIDARVAAGWLAPVREHIRCLGTEMQLRPRDFAATLVAAVVSPAGAIIVHVGDGAAVVRHAQTGEWSVPSWPSHGEYANTTHFVIDEPLALDCQAVVHPIDRVVVLTDGMENLILDARNRTVPKPFFDRLTQPVADATGSGRDRRLSRHLRSYLSGAEVCAATDDDKTLVIGALA